MKLSINEYGLLVIEHQPQPTGAVEHWLLTPKELLEAINRYEPSVSGEYPNRKKIVCYGSDRSNFVSRNHDLKPEHLRALRLLADSLATPNQLGMAAGNFANRILAGETFDGPAGRPSRHQLGAIGRYVCQVLVDFGLANRAAVHAPTTYHITEKGKEYIIHVH